MSSEWNDPGTSWQQPPKQVHEDEEYEEILSPPPDSDHSRFEAFQQFGEHLFPLFIPLLFAGLTFLFILPLALRNQSYIHAAYLWPVSLVIVALAIVQGTVLFYADTNDVFWSLAIGGGFCLFVLLGTFTIFGPTAAIILLLIFVVLSVVVIRLYSHHVHDEHADIVFAFGKYARTLNPGFHFRLPWETIIGSAQTRVVIWTCPEQRVPMSRDEDVHLKATVSYQLLPEDAYLVAPQIDTWEENLHNLICNELQLIAGALTPDDFLIWPQGSQSFQHANTNQNSQDVDEMLRWEHINHLLLEKLLNKAALWGVQINWVQIRDITLTPRVVYTARRSAMENTTAFTTAGGATQYASEQQSQSAHAEYAPIDLDNDTTERIEHSSMMSPPDSSPFSQGNTAAPVRPTKIPREEVLIQAYRQVQTGKITSPTAIRSIAANFEAVAADPALNSNVSFNAVLAAQTLYERADMYERHGYRSAPEMSEHETISMSMPSGMGNRVPNDENMTAGG
jgi:regulator of protease activity HflC (stomatin/prohibitin superfamily)